MFVHVLLDIPEITAKKVSKRGIVMQIIKNLFYIKYRFRVELCGCFTKANVKRRNGQFVITLLCV